MAMSQVARNNPTITKPRAFRSMPSNHCQNEPVAGRHGRGMYGPQRYACGQHRGELKAEIRELYGTLGWHRWAIGPHPWAGRRGTDRARRLVRSLRSTFGAPGS